MVKIKTKDKTRSVLTFQETDVYCKRFYESFGYNASTVKDEQFFTVYEIMLKKVNKTNFKTWSVVKWVLRTMKVCLQKLDDVGLAHCGNQ